MRALTEGVAIAWEVFLFMCMIVALFVWAFWQDFSAWGLRRLGYTTEAANRVANADLELRAVLGIPEDV